MYPEDYQKFVRVIDQVEDEVSEICMFPPEVDNNARYREIAKILSERIKTNFTFLDDIMIKSLCDRVMADWIVRCPIKFD